MSDIIWNDDIKIEDGTFAIGENTAAQSQFIIEATKGNFFWAATLGVGIIGKVNSETNQVDLQGEITRELKKDNIKLTSLEVVNDEYNITVANRNNI